MIHSSGSDEVHSDEWGGELNPKHNMKIGPGPGLGGTCLDPVGWCLPCPGVGVTAWSGRGVIAYSRGWYPSMH